MAEIFRSTLRARGLRTAPLALALLLTSSAFLLGWADGGVNPFTVTLLASVYAIVSGAGLIGNDVADGTVQLVLARSITRNQYLAGRLLGLATVALTAGLLMVACGGAGGLINPRPHHGGWEEFGLTALTVSVHLLWQVALCFALSTFCPGRGDVVVYLLLLLSSQVLASQAGEVMWPWLASAFHWWKVQVWNDFAVYGGRSPAFWQDLARWSSNLVAALLIGCAVFHRREFSYGAG